MYINNEVYIKGVYRGIKFSCTNLKKIDRFTIYVKEGELYCNTVDEVKIEIDDYVERKKIIDFNPYNLRLIKDGETE